MRLIYILPLALLLITAVCVSRAGPSGTARVGPGLELSLASFNIRYGTADDGPDAWPHRRDMVTGLLARLDADVIGLQEALRFQLDELAADLPGYAEIGVGRDDGATRGEYAAILVRTERFAIDEAGTFWLSDTPQTVASTHWGNRITRVCTWARLIDKATGRGFYVFNAHLDHQSQPSRERSAELIAAKAAGRAHADEPVVLMGDFNAGEDNRALRYLRGEADRASDPEAWPGHAPPAPVPRAAPRRDRGRDLQRLCAGRDDGREDRPHPGVARRRGAGGDDRPREPRRALPLGPLRRDGAGAVRGRVRSGRGRRYSTVTLLARFRGLSTSWPRRTAAW